MLITLCDDLKNADNKVQELLLLIRTVWYRIERQVLVIRSLDRVDGAFRNLQDEILQALQIKLRDTSAKVSKLSSASLLRRFVCVMGQLGGATARRICSFWTGLMMSTQENHLRYILERLAQKICGRSRSLVCAMGSFLVSYRPTGWTARG